MTSASRPLLPSALRISVVVTSGLSLATACIPLSRGRTYESKRMTAKQGENSLVALDGTVCMVARNTIDRVRVGERHRCVWAPPSRESEPSRVRRAGRASGV